MFVCLILTLFYVGLRPPLTPPPTAFEGHVPTAFFITGLLICHSFLDFLYIDDCAVGRGAHGGQSPLSEFAISQVSLYAQKIEGKRNDK
jgi:hypothetical protein